MKLMWILCLGFVSLHNAVGAVDETSTIDTTLPRAETTFSSDFEKSTIDTTLPNAETTLSSDLEERPTEPSTEAPINSNDKVADFSDSTSTTLTDTTPVPGESTTIITNLSEAPIEGSPSEINSTMVIIKLSNQIRTVLEHFQQENPIGFPGQDILPDPLPAPNVTAGGILGKGEFYNIVVYGLANFTVESVNMLLDQMTVYVQIRLKDVYIFGNYTQDSGFFFTSTGPFNLTLGNVTAEGILFLVVEPDGSLHANRSMTKIKYEKVMFHYGEKSSAPLSSVVDAAGLTVIGTILPFIQALIDERLTTEVNKQLKDSPKFPAIRDIPPVDLAIMKGRQYVEKKYNPYVVQNMINFDSDYFALKVGPVTLNGLSNFARVGDVSFGMVNKTMVIKLRMITGRIYGDTNFYFNFGKIPQIPARLGKANFSVHHIQFEAIIHQSMITKKKPLLDDLQLEVGPIEVKLDNRGNFDYFIELIISRLPEFLRYYLIDILEEPIKRKIQKDILDEVNMDDVVALNLLPSVEKMLQENKL